MTGNAKSHGYSPRQNKNAVLFALRRPEAAGVWGQSPPVDTIAECPQRQNKNAVLFALRFYFGGADDIGA
jgi:hypothetical protein